MELYIFDLSLLLLSMCLIGFIVCLICISVFRIILNKMEERMNEEWNQLLN